MLIANILSFILHPAFMPLVGLLIVFNSGVYGVEVPSEFRRYVYLITFLCDILFPLTMIPVLMYFHSIRQASIDDRRERLIPLFITSLCLFIGYYLVAKFSPIQLVNLFLFASCLVVVIILMISIFWKVSIHMAGIGGITALILILSFIYKTDLTIILCVAVLISGIIASARLALNAHSPVQLIGGYLIGLLTVIFCMALPFLSSPKTV
jgi:membrane-associated phospholipid phosphatase